MAESTGPGDHLACSKVRELELQTKVGPPGPLGRPKVKLSTCIEHRRKPSGDSWARSHSAELLSRAVCIPGKDEG
jgi:hypothetical protein